MKSPFFPAALAALLFVATVHADPADDARIAVALASAARPTPPVQPAPTCACTGPADCSCLAKCVCPQCVAAAGSLEWRRYPDGDPSCVWLLDTRTGKQVGCYMFDMKMYQAKSADGGFLPPGQAPIPTPLGIEEVPALPAASPVVRPVSVVRSMPAMMSMGMMQYGAACMTATH